MGKEDNRKRKDERKVDGRRNRRWKRWGWDWIFRWNWENN